MTENPGNPAGTGGPPPESGTPPVPPPVPPGPAAGYQAPPAGYQAPPAGYQAPAAEPGPAGAGLGQQFGNFDPKTLQNFDPKSVNPLDWGIIAAGVVAFIFSTFGFFTYSVSVAGFSNSASVSAWHGFFAPVAILLALLASLLLAVQLIAKLELPFPVRTVVLAAFGVAALFLLIALLVVPGNTGGANGVFGVRIDKGHGVGYWISLIAVLAGTGLAAKRFLDHGSKLSSQH